MTLNQILYFYTVAKCRNFRLAAAELSISQPSLSRSVANLEDELGLILLDRSGRSIELTKYGKLFFTHAERILNDVELAESQMKKLAGSGGSIDIAYVFPLAAKYIPHIVHSFLGKGKNQNITFRFHQNHTADLVEGLKARRYDVIFSSYAENEPDIHFTPILTQKMIVITPPGHPLASHKTLSIHDLESYPVIGYDRTSGLGRYTSRIYASYNIHPDIICDSPDENAIASLVSENFGVALVANVDILDYFKLEKLHLTDVRLSHTVYLGYMKSQYQIPAVKNFISFIQKEGTNLEP